MSGSGSNRKPGSSHQKLAGGSFRPVGQGSAASAALYADWARPQLQLQQDQGDVRTVQDLGPARKQFLTKRISHPNKGTVSRGGFDFWWHVWHVWLVLGLNRGRCHFLKSLRCSSNSNFILQKVYFSWLMRVYVGLIMLAAYFCHSC